MEERIASFEQSHDETKEILNLKSYHKETKQKILHFKDEYRFALKHKNYIHKRLLKAFPTLTAKNREGALRDLKIWLFTKNKKNIPKEYHHKDSDE